jgi:hypothetical protein
MFEANANQETPFCQTWPSAKDELPYVVLTRYKPSKRRCKIIGRELTAITKKLGLRPFKNDEIKRNPKAGWFNYDLHAEVRMTAVAGSEAEGFHQDGDTSVSHDEMNFAMVVWSNKTPTQIQYKGKIYQPKPFEVVLFKNLSAYHRRPMNCPNHRFLFRQRCVVPTHIQLP